MQLLPLSWYEIHFDDTDAVLLAPAVTVLRRRELWILPPFCFLPVLLPITLQENKPG